jgi:hypothetical protein
MEFNHIDGKITLTTIERNDFGQRYTCDRPININEAIRLKTELEKAIEIEKAIEDALDFQNQSRQNHDKHP